MKTFIIATLFAGCLLAFGGEISDYHFKKVHDKSGQPPKLGSQAEVEPSNHGITEIGIERSACYGKCPTYTFIAKRDGTIRYKGEKNVEREGDFTGTIPVSSFNRLAKFIKASEYINLADSYYAPITDNPVTYTMVVMNGKRKTVSNYTNAGPSKLWAIEQLIDGLMAETKWNASEKPQVQK